MEGTARRSAGLTVYREELETEIGRSVTGLLDALHRQDGEGGPGRLYRPVCRPVPGGSSRGWGLAVGPPALP